MGSEDDDDHRRSRKMKAKVADDAKGHGEYEEDDFVVADSSDEDFEGGQGQERG